FSGQFSERVAVRVIAMVAVLNLAEDDIVAPVLVDEASDIGRIADEEGLPRTDDDVEPREIEVSSGGPLCDGSLPAVEQCDPPPSTTAARLHILPVDNQEVAAIAIAVDLELSFFGLSPERCALSRCPWQHVIVWLGAGGNGADQPPQSAVGPGSDVLPQIPHFHATADASGSSQVTLPVLVLEHRAQRQDVDRAVVQTCECRTPFEGDGGHSPEVIRDAPRECAVPPFRQNATVRESMRKGSRWGVSGVCVHDSNINERPSEHQRTHPLPPVIILGLESTAAGEGRSLGVRWLVRQPPADRRRAHGP